ncbi:MAG: 2,3-bisphosphoglycerate-independent phosphoglycerate mutase [Halobacteria archaeon]
MNSRKAALIIVDGWGIRNESTGENRNAFEGADTSYMDGLLDDGLIGLLETYGPSVGVTEGQMGNSEVGHLNIGAGRIVKQPIARIDDDVESGDFFENSVLLDAVESGGDLHLMGLVSDGGVHSAQRHLHALIELADRHDREAHVHAFLDGRDTPPKSAEKYLGELEDVCDEHGAEISTVAGRYYAMDRDENWERTEKAYDAMVDGEKAVENGENVEVDQDVYLADSALDAVESAYVRGESDEFVKPTVIADRERIKDGDSVVFFNFRGDRARQISRMLNGVDVEWGRDTELDLDFRTFTEYDEGFGFPVAYPPALPEDVLGELVSRTKFTQFRIAETEKYAHVTYFLNGGREEEFEGEERVIVPSPGVGTYEKTPEMSAREVTERTMDVVGEYDLIVMNYANPDMVGHTGDLEAAVESIECIDDCLSRLVPELLDSGYAVFVTSDHGNAEEMGSVEDPQTAHTFNPTPFVARPTELIVDREVPDYEVIGELRDVAPTVLDVMDIEPSELMTGSSLLR